MTKVVDQFRMRKEDGKNYMAVYSNRHVVRFFDDELGPIEATTVPEFMDIKLTDQCNGNCPYCYQNSTNLGKCAENPIQRLEEYFAGVELKDMPFQVALGGGDPLLHPQFEEICQWLADHGVVPNLTTNGLNFTEDNLRVIEDLCGGCAVTAHRHLDAEWRAGLDQLIPYCVAPAIHVLYHDAESIEYIRGILEDYGDKVYAIVMLPLVAQGRASGMDDSVDTEALDAFIASLNDDQLSKLAWGAMAYEYFRCHPRLSKVLSLYEPEQFSLYLDLTTMREYPSSFAVEELKNLSEG